MAVWIRSWRRHLKAGNYSPKTIETYTESAGLFNRYLLTRSLPQDPVTVTRVDVEDWVTALLARWRPATAKNRFQGLQAFFSWLVEEGELAESPMAKMHQPRVAVQPPAVVTEDDLRKLLAACAGPAFDDRRDHAILRVFIDTGARRSEVGGLRFDPRDDTQNDVDLDQQYIRVMGKRGSQRVLPIGDKTVKALDRYLRARARHAGAHQPWLWLGGKGRLGDHGMAQMLARRCAQAGLPKLHLHLLRHTFAHEWLSGGGNEGDLMRITGWKSRSMIERYGASAAVERAREAHKRHSPGDRV